MQDNIQNQGPERSDTNSVTSKDQPEKTTIDDKYKRRKFGSSLKNFLWGLALYGFCLSAPLIYSYFIEYARLLNIQENINILSGKIIEYIIHLLPIDELSTSPYNIHHQHQQNLVSALKWIALFSNALALARILLVYALVPRYLGEMKKYK